MNHTLLTRVLSLSLYGLSIAVLTSSNVFAQVPRSKVELRAKDLLSGMGTDQRPVQATGLPRADLMVKDMCLEDGKTAEHGYVGVLLANVGTADAGFFELGFEYKEPGISTFATSPVKGLRVGEEIWIREWHACCGWYPIDLIKAAEAFSAIADPKYHKKGNDGSPYEVKPVVPETNEANNQMTVRKAGLKPCTTITRVDKPTAPAGVKTIKTPIIKP